MTSQGTTADVKEKPKYVVSNIPAELRQNVDAVVWEDKMFYQIQSKNRATQKVVYSVTIFNDNKKDLARVIVPYDKLSKITSLKGAVYDEQGFLIKKIKPSEIYDQIRFDGFSLYSDNRFKMMNLQHGRYPYTIEFEYETEFRYLFEIPDFYLHSGERISVIESEYTLTYPPALKPRYSLNRINDKPEITQVSPQLESMSWKFKNLKPIRLEPFGPSFYEVLPTIKSSPTAFEFEGYAGSMETWDSFGQWIASLSKGRDVVPQATIQKVKSITNEFPSKEEKIMAVFEYLQSKTRYVSIQLGIGGLQPFEASVVDQVGYGDCKALSNYMVSLLKAIDIKAHYVLIDAGDSPRKIDHTFPSSTFNHATVCVPMEKDTIWLECTSQSIPFGYVGGFTGNRKALAITDNGAVAVRTPVYTENENVMTRTANVTVGVDGNAIAKVATRYHGMQYDAVREALSGTYDAQKKWVQNNTAIPVFDIAAFSIKEKKARIPEAIVNLDLELRKLATVSGKRIFLTPNLMNKSTFIPPKVENRTTPVVLKNAYTHIDTINYTISDQIYPEFLPEPVKIQSRFGEYESSFTLDQGKVVYVRRFVRKNGEFPAESYNEFIEFYKSVSKADASKLVFLNKT